MENSTNSTPSELQQELASFKTMEGLKTFDALVNKSRLVREENPPTPEEEAENQEVVADFNRGEINAVMTVMEHIGQIALFVNLTGRTLDELVAHCTTSSAAYVGQLELEIQAELNGEDGPGVDTGDEE